MPESKNSICTSLCFLFLLDGYFFFFLMGIIYFILIAKSTFSGSRQVTKFKNVTHVMIQKGNVNTSTMLVIKP